MLRVQRKWVKPELVSIALHVCLGNSGAPPSCIYEGWFRSNIKIVACGDLRSVALYKKVVSSLEEVYLGARLIAVDFKDLPSRPRAKSGEYYKDDTAFQLL